MDTLLQSQIPFIISIQKLGDFTLLMRFVSGLGQETFGAVLLAFLYLCVDARLGARLMIVMIGSACLNELFKLLGHQPRPYWLDGRVLALATESTYGLPSGHAQSAVVLWWYSASVLRRTWGWVGALVLIMLIASSRIYLGVHFFTDIIGGWLIAAIWLRLFYRLEAPVVTWFKSLNLVQQVCMIVGVSASVFLVGASVRAWFATLADPADWAAFAVNARNLDTLAAMAGGLCGGGLGLLMVERWARFEQGGTGLQRLACFVSGALSLLLLNEGLKLFFPTEPEWVSLTLRVVRYTLVLWWLTFVTPWLALRLRWLKPAT
jgi:membrane-associated phospholipid phosphatase